MSGCRKERVVGATRWRAGWIEGDSNEVSDEGVPCALPLEDLPLAIVVSPSVVHIK